MVHLLKMVDRSMANCSITREYLIFPLVSVGLCLCEWHTKCSAAAAQLVLAAS